MNNFRCTAASRILTGGNACEVEGCALRVVSATRQRGRGRIKQTVVGVYERVPFFCHVSTLPPSLVCDGSYRWNIFPCDRISINNGLFFLFNYVVKWTDRRYWDLPDGATCRARWIIKFLIRYLFSAGLRSEGERRYEIFNLNKSSERSFI